MCERDDWEGHDPSCIGGRKGPCNCGATDTVPVPRGLLDIGLRIPETSYTRALANLVRHIVDDYGGDTVKFYAQFKPDPREP